MKKNTFGEMIRTLRKQQKLPLRVVASAIEIDSTLLSKIERGERLPTEKQIEKLAQYFNIPLDDLRARAIADKIIDEYGINSSTLRAIGIIKEHFKGYRVGGISKNGL